MYTRTKEKKRKEKLLYIKGSETGLCYDDTFDLHDDHFKF